MKKGVLLFLILFLIPSAFAVINIKAPGSDEYNLGDGIQVEGYIYEDKSVTGFLKLEVICGESSFNLPMVGVTLNENEKKTFPDIIKLPKVIVSSSMSGSCNIKLSLLSNSEVIDESESSAFIVTKELDGNFNVDKTKLQVGMPVTITGDVFKLNGGNTGGSIEIYFRNNGTSYLVDVINSPDGKLNYKYIPVATPAGDYDIDIMVNDIFGNRQLFESIASLEIVDKFDVFLKLGQTNYMPGDKLELNGEVRDVLGGLVEQAKVFILLDGNEYKTSLKKGLFSYNMIIPLDIKSGSHDMIVKLEDDYGNTGEETIRINVNAMISKVGVEFNADKIKPDNDIEIIPYVYDQAGDIVDEDISVEIFDPDQNRIFSDIVKAAKKVVFRVPKFSIPGLYTVTTHAVDLEDKGGFNVDSVVDAELTLSNQTLYIKNVGNVDYKKPVKIDFDEGKYSVMKQATLKPEESMEIYLNEEVPTGAYVLDIKYGDKEEHFDNVDLVGVSKGKFNYSYFLYGILIIGLVGGWLFIRRKGVSLPKVGTKIKKVKVNVKKPEKTFKHSFGKANEKDLEDFRSRVIRDIKDTQKNSDRRGDKFDNNEGGMFGMFN